MPATVVSVDQFTEKQRRKAMQVLDLLDRAEERLHSHYSRKRQHDRKNYRGIVTVVVPAEGFLGDSASAESVRFDVWARNISSGGLSFIHPGELALGKILIGLNGNQPQAAWFSGNVVRSQMADDNFWEYGVAFTGRAAM